MTVAGGVLGYFDAPPGLLEAFQAVCLSKAGEMTDHRMAEDSAGLSRGTLAPKRPANRERDALSCPSSCCA